MTGVAERAEGALVGFILGDSLGRTTCGMSPDVVLTSCGMITGPGEPEAHPHGPSSAVSSATARTEHMMIAARLIKDDRTIDPLALAEALLRWDRDGEGSADHEPLEPELRSALEQTRHGNGGNGGHVWSTSESAIWAVPLGIAHSQADGAESLGSAVDVLCRAGSYTRLSVEAASLVAHAVSAAVDGEAVDDAIDSALAIVAGEEPRGRWTGEASAVARTLQAIDWADDLREIELLGHIQMIVGWSRAPGEAIPAALVLAKAFAREPYRGLCAIAQLGGESSLIASLSGAILGAAGGTSAFPLHVAAQLEHVGESGRLSKGLLALSGRGSAVCEAWIR